jgi:hypothetical protein
LGIGCIRYGTVSFPGLAVGLACHVRQGVEPILREKGHLVNGDILLTLASLVKGAAGVDIPVWWSVEFGGIALQRMGAPLPDVYGGRSGKTLGAQDIEPQGASIRILSEGQPILLSGLVTGDQWSTVLYGCGCSGENGNP